MTRPTDKELIEALEERVREALQRGSYDLSGAVAYAQLRAMHAQNAHLERLADNVFNLDKTLAVIRADWKNRAMVGPLVWSEPDEGGE